MYAVKGKTWWAGIGTLTHSIFYKETCFSNLHWNIKFISFPELKLYFEGPKIMVNKCVATNCSTSYKTGQKKASFHFLQDQELKRKWIYFVNRKDWLPNANSVICVVFCRKNDLSTPTIARKGNIWLDELVLFQAADKIVDTDSISEQNSPQNFTINSVQLFNLKCNEEAGILAVKECISRRVTRGAKGRGGGLPCLFSKIGEKCPNLGQEYPDCCHLRIKFLV